MARLPEAADELFVVDPPRFIAARDAMARELKAKGEVAAADEVKRLRKPSVAAAALNRVARDEPSLVDDVVTATEKVATAQRAGGGDALRQASRDRRAAVQALVSRAAGLAGAAHRDAIAGTVEATAVDDEVAAALRAGRLTKDVAAPGAFDLTGMPDAPALAKRERPDPALARKKAKAEADVARAERDLEAAEAALAKAEERTAAARAALDDAQAALDALT